jgi:hypothetical protein
MAYRAAAQAVLRPARFLYVAIGPQNTRLLAEFLDIGSNRKPVRQLPGMVLILTTRKASLIAHQGLTIPTCACAASGCLDHVIL